MLDVTATIVSMNETETVDPFYIDDLARRYPELSGVFDLLRRLSEECAEMREEWVPRDDLDDAERRAEHYQDEARIAADEMENLREYLRSLVEDLEGFVS